jgi:hypothetical protein
LNRLYLIATLFAFGLAVGCGSSDPNKDLKPIDPNTPPPKPVKGEGPGRTGDAGDRPTAPAK